MLLANKIQVYPSYYLNLPQKPFKQTLSPKRDMQSNPFIQTAPGEPCASTIFALTQNSKDQSNGQCGYSSIIFNTQNDHHNSKLPMQKNINPVHGRHSQSINVIKYTIFSSTPRVSPLLTELCTAHQSRIYPFTQHLSAGKRRKKLTRLKSTCTTNNMKHSNIISWPSISSKSIGFGHGELSAYKRTWQSSLFKSILAHQRSSVHQDICGLKSWSTTGQSL